MATQIKRTAIAECFNIATKMDRFKKRWLSDDAIVEGMKESFPQLKKEGFDATELNRALAEDRVHGFRNIRKEGSTNTTGVHVISYRFDRTASGTPQRHRFYIIGSNGAPLILPSKTKLGPFWCKIYLVGNVVNTRRRFHDEASGGDTVVPRDSINTDKEDEEINLELEEAECNQ